jgi:hypothetical protein
MEPNESMEQPGSLSPPASPGNAPAALLPSGAHSAPAISSQARTGSCTHCGSSRESEGNGTGTASFVYAIGNVEPRFPSLSVEKEFAQATGRADSGGLTNRKALKKVLSDRGNRYLVRQLCWAFTVEGLETYLLLPRDPTDLDLLAEAVRDQPSPIDLDVLIGVRGPIAPPEMCNGLMVPIVVFDQIYSFDRESFIGAIPKQGDTEDDAFQAASEEIFDRIMQLADNAGATDEHRALNYLAVRYPQIYARAAQAYQDNFSLTSVEVRPSRLSSTRKIVEVIFAFANRESDFTEKSAVSVDVTEEFPFLVRKLSPYYDR